MSKQIQQNGIVKKSNFDLERVHSAEKLIADEFFIQCHINDDDELYQNGIFVFNITKLIELSKIGELNINADGDTLYFYAEIGSQEGLYKLNI